MATLATLITQLRTLARDLPTSNKSLGETAKPGLDGSGTHFRLQNPILFLVSSVPQIWWTDATHYRSQSGIVIDDANLGMITVSPAPAAGVVFDYFYNWFVDTDYTEFLNDAARDLIGVGDPTTVQDGLISALLSYALGHFWMARATQYAHRYSSGGGSVSQQVSSVTKGFQALADSANKKAEASRDQFYEDLGSRAQSASAKITFGIDPMTPPR